MNLGTHDANRVAMATRIAVWLIANGGDLADSATVRHLNEAQWTWIADQMGERVPSIATRRCVVADLELRAATDTNPFASFAGASS